MIRTMYVLTLMILVIINAPVFPQETTFQSKNNTYDPIVIENFEKLGFNWSLPPLVLEIMNGGLNSLNSGNWRNAIKLFDKVIQFDSTFIPAYYYHFTCYEVGKKTMDQKITNYFNEFIRTHSKSNIKLYTDLWDVYIPSKSNSRNYSPLLEIAPPLSFVSNYLVHNQNNLSSESSNYLKKAFASLIIARPNEALSLVDKAHEVEQSLCALYLKAVIFQFMSKHDSAFHLYNEILNKDESIIEAHENLSLYKSNLKDKIGTLKHLESLKKLKPGSHRILRFSGLLKVQIEDYYGAILDLTSYLNVDPTDFDCIKQRAIAQYKVKSYSESIKDLNIALNLYNRDLDIYLYQSENYLRLGDSTKCIKILTDAKKVFSFDQRLDLFTADKLVEVNKIRQAQEIIDRVVRVVTLNNFDSQYLNQAYLTQSNIYLRKGNPQRAHKTLNSLIEKNGEQFDYLFMRAKIFISQGEKEKAKIDLERLIRAGYEPAVDIYNNL